MPFTRAYRTAPNPAGGDLFEKIEKMSTVTERAAAALFRELVECVAYCHTLGVMHRE